MQNRVQPTDEGLRLTAARVHDLCDRAMRGYVGISSFLTPREALLVSRLLSDRLAAGTAVLWGGFVGAERVRAVILPDYAEGLADPAELSRDPVSALMEVGLDDLAAAVRAGISVLCVRGSGFRALSHRDYLGSVLGLGIERDAIGDIVAEGAAPATGTPPCAYVVTDERMGDFLLSRLEKVANDTVRVTRLPPGDRVSFVRRTSPIRDTVASERLDCVVAALCNISREKAQTAIRSGIVELDYEPCVDCDRTVVPPSVISVRGCGKFSVEAFDGETRKGRLRLSAGKYL